MKLDKAIELSPDIVRSLRSHKFIDHADAVQMGLEALKRITTGRLRHHPYSRLLLPGETPENTPTRSLHHIKAVLESPLGRKPKV